MELSLLPLDEGLELDFHLSLAFLLNVLASLGEFLHVSRLVQKGQVAFVEVTLCFHGGLFSHFLADVIPVSEAVDFHGFQKFEFLISSPISFEQRKVQGLENLIVVCLQMLGSLGSV